VHATTECWPWPVPRALETTLRLLLLLVVVRA
jgi:hypothetical protein